MKITEDTIIKHMMDFLTECDADELARLTGEIFGGNCSFDGENYNFTPNENYFNAFQNEEVK